MTKKHWTSGLNRDDMLKDLEVNLGKIAKSQQQALIALAEELDSELLDCAENHGRLDQPNKEYVASVVYINGDFYGDLETGVINHAEIKPDLVDAARNLGLLDEDGYDYDALMALSEWSYHWSVE